MAVAKGVMQAGTTIAVAKRRQLEHSGNGDGLASEEDDGEHARQEHGVYQVLAAKQLRQDELLHGSSFLVKDAVLMGLTANVSTRKPPVNATLPSRQNANN